MRKRSFAGDGLRRAGWAIAALACAVLYASLAHLDHVPQWVLPFGIALAALAAFRPAWAFTIFGAIFPIAGYVMRLRWNGQVAWSEAAVLAVLTGWAARRSVEREDGPPAPLVMWAVVFGAIVLSSAIATIPFDGVALGNDLWRTLADTITVHFLQEVRPFQGLHAGVLFLEGLLLAVAVASIVRRQARALAWLAAGAATGSALAGLIDVAEFARRSARTPGPFWTLFINQLSRFRYNIHYADVNAAGSYFVMMMVLAIAAARAFEGRFARAALVTAAGCSAAGLWLSGSRTAMLAGIVAVAGSFVARRLRARGPALLGAALAGAIAVALLAAIWEYMPTRGNQKASTIAVTVRAEMARAALGMIAAHPVLGVGVGQFTVRAGEFASAAVLAIFPAAHENAHNQFLQIAAELGLPALAAFLGFLFVAFRAAPPSPDAALLRRGAVVALTAYLLSAVGGHPLLTREAAYAFWLVLGMIAAWPVAAVPSRAGLAVATIVVAAAVASTPLRARSMLAEAELEHLGVGVSPWHWSEDGIRCRDADDTATLFIQANAAVGLSIEPLSPGPVQLQLTLDGRPVGVVHLAPHAWNDLVLPPRDRRTRERYSRLDLRVVGAEGHTKLLITKVHPLD